MPRLNNSGDGAPDFVTNALINGMFFSTGQRFPSVAGGNTKKIYLENPSDSGVAVFPVGPIIRANGESIGQKAKSVTEDTQGDPPTTGITNKATGVTDSSQTIARIGGDNETGAYSGGIVIQQR